MKITHHFCKMRLKDGDPVRGVLNLTTAMKPLGRDVKLVTTDNADVPDAWKHPNDEWPEVQPFAEPAIGGACPSSSSSIYLAQFGVLDDRAGLTYCTLQAIYEYQIVLKVRELRRVERGLPPA